MHHHGQQQQHMMMGESHNSGSTFCDGDAMVMYMDGFHWSLRGGHSCLNLLWPSWTLQNRFRFVAACIGTMVLGFAVESCSNLRYRLHHQWAARRQRNNNKRMLLFLLSLLHGSQALMGYVLMLITMTFSVELLLSVVIGLSVGYGVWFRWDNPHPAAANPCCDFLQEEYGESLLPPPPPPPDDDEPLGRRVGGAEEIDEDRRGLL